MLQVRVRGPCVQPLSLFFSLSLSLSLTHTHTHTLRAADVKDSPEPCNLGGPTVVQEVLQPASNANVAEPQEGTSVMQPPKKNKRRMVEQ